MSVSGKTVYRVKQVVAHDVAIIAEVKDVDGGGVKETRDSRIALGGIDSFWLVGGEKKEKKLAFHKKDTPVPALAVTISPMATRIRGKTPIFDLPKIANDIAIPGKFDAVSFASATRLNVGYSPQGGDPDERLSALMEGTLHIPLAAAVSSIEVRPGRWLTSGFDVLPAGRYELQRQSLRSVATVSLENRPDMIRLAHGLVVFVSQPKWSEPRNVDLRSEEEILQSAERWLSRSTAVVSLPADVRSMAPAELLRLLADRAVNEDEKADLAAVAGLLSTRSELADILPDILRRDPAFKEMLASFEESEMALIRTQLDAQIRSETEASSARLAALRGEIAAAEAMLETFSHREALLRSETEKHEETLRSRIASAAEVIRSESSRETAAIRDEVALLWDEIAQITTAPVAPAVAVPEQSEIPLPASSLPPMASDEQRQKTLREMAVAVGLSASEIATVIATSTDSIPVLIGADAMAAAVAIVTALAGEEAAIVFCDPTKVSLADILNDEHSGLLAAINKAKERPEALAAAAFCSITNAPCEYWLPQIVEMRKVGRLPRNLAIIASAGTDGMRISIPDSALRHLFPLATSKLARSGAVKFEGLWPSAKADQERSREAVDLLIDRGLEGTVLQSMSKALACTPSWLKVSDLADVFLRQAKWLAASSAGDEHEHDKYFKNLES